MVVGGKDVSAASKAGSASAAAANSSMFAWRMSSWQPLPLAAAEMFRLASWQRQSGQSLCIIPQTLTACSTVGLMFLYPESKAIRLRLFKLCLSVCSTLYLERISGQVNAGVPPQPAAGAALLQGIRNVVHIAAAQIQQFELLSTFEAAQSLLQASIQHQVAEVVVLRSEESANGIYT